MKKNILLCAGIILLLSRPACAAIQLPDVLIYNGKTYKVWGFTLSEKMIENKDIFFNKPENKYKEWKDRDNYDGIDVSLSIKDEKLYVMKIDRFNWEILGRPSSKDIYGVDIPEEGLITDWFSGELSTEPWLWNKEETTETYCFEKGVLQEIKKGPTP